MEASDARPAWRSWAGVAADVGLTLVLLALGIDPVFSLVSGHRREAALVFGALHMVTIPVAMITGVARGEVGRDAQDRVGRAMDTAFLLLYALGWLLPTVIFASGNLVPGWMIGGCIVAHVAPLVVAVVGLLLGLGRQLDRASAWVARRSLAQAILYGGYLSLVEVFLVLARSEPRGQAGFALGAWLVSYLPARLLLARLTGLHGPERWTFAAANVHLLIRLLLARG